MNTLTVALPTEGVPFLESLSQELLAVIEEAGLTREDMNRLLDPRVRVTRIGNWI